MAARFIRRVRTASGAVAVQVISREGREITGVEHVGSARSDAELEALIAVAEQRLRPGQLELDLGPVVRQQARLEDVADWTTKDTDGEDKAVGDGAMEVLTGDTAAPAPAESRPGGDGRRRVVSARSDLLWDVLAGAYAHLGFDVIGDEAFKAVVLARLIEPTSKAEVPRVLGEYGLNAPSLRTIFRALQRCQARDYRGQLAKAATGYSARTHRAQVVLYDCTTLAFTAEKEDDLRKVGLSKERRIDPQVQLGLLVDAAGMPLEVHMFPGNTAETTTLIPVLRSFQERHGVTDMVVVADAGMLSAANLNALEDAGFAFIVGSRTVKAPYDLAEHFARHGDYFEDGQILESRRVMGTGKNARQRRIVYQYKFDRAKRDNRVINDQIARAEKNIANHRIAKDKFVKVRGAQTELNQATIDRARQLAGIKGYVTSLPTETMTGAAVIAAYHDLFEVERTFRMAKTDLRARPVFHHTRESIEAHLSVVFAALAIARHLQDATGYSIAKIVKTLRPIRTMIAEINGQRLDFPADPSPEAEHILNAVKQGH